MFRGQHRSNKVKALITIGFMTFGLFGCATTNEVYAPDGEVALIVDCSGEFLNWGACDTKAGDTCKERGYTILKKDSDKTSSGFLTGSGGSLFGKSSAVMNRTMMFRCNDL